MLASPVGIGLRFMLASPRGSGGKVRYLFRVVRGGDKGCRKLFVGGPRELQSEARQNHRLAYAHLAES